MYVVMAVGQLPDVPVKPIINFSDISGHSGSAENVGTKEQVKY